MGTKDKDPRRDIWWGDDGIERLDRLCASFSDTAASIARRALLEFELRQVEIRDMVCDAVLDLLQAQVPDGQYDPADDPREALATARLGALLGSSYAAQGVAEAFRLLLAHNPTTLLSIPSREQDISFVEPDAPITES
jgi:hypothetical protein